jgi:hypothetical protein
VTLRPRLAGILVVLPIVAGPILLVSLAAFALIFAHLSRRHGWFVVLLMSWVTVLVAVLDGPAVPGHEHPYWPGAPRFQQQRSRLGSSS